MLSDGFAAVKIQAEAGISSASELRSNRRYNLESAMDPSPASLEALNERIVACELCPRLRAHCTEVARVRRRAYADWEYWGRPVPSFGDPEARVLALGLAPGAHGSNRTGRPFTGDGSGDFLYPVLHEAGFASYPKASSREDGMKLTGLWITSVVRCAPPGNKPTPEEQRNCAPWLDQELRCWRISAWSFAWAASPSMDCWPTNNAPVIYFLAPPLCLVTVPNALYQVVSLPLRVIIRLCKIRTPASSLAPCFSRSSIARGNCPVKIRAGLE